MNMPLRLVQGLAGASGATVGAFLKINGNFISIDSKLIQV